MYHPVWLSAPHVGMLQEESEENFIFRCSLPKLSNFSFSAKFRTSGIFYQNVKSFENKKISNDKIFHEISFFQIFKMKIAFLTSYPQVFRFFLFYYSESRLCKNLLLVYA